MTSTLRSVPMSTGPVSVSTTLIVTSGQAAYPRCYQALSVRASSYPDEVMAVSRRPMGS